jgi:hypothetical protein
LAIQEEKTRLPSLLDHVVEPPLVFEDQVPKKLVTFLWWGMDVELSR